MLSQQWCPTENRYARRPSETLSLFSSRFGRKEHEIRSDPVCVAFIFIHSWLLLLDFVSHQIGVHGSKFVSEG